MNIKIFKNVRLLASLVFGSLFLFYPLCFADGLVLSIGVPGTYGTVKSFDKTLTVRTQPTPFTVILENNSGSSQSVYWESDAGGIVNLSFEFSDENSGTFVVRHKKKQVMSNAVVNTYLSGGTNVAKTIIVDPDAWENVPIIEQGKEKKYKVCAIYDNNGSSVYSDYYTLIFNGT